MCTVLAIDIGTKYCGLALSQNNRKFGLNTIQFNNDFQRLKVILSEILKNYNPDIIVLGKTDYEKSESIKNNYYLPIIKNTLPNVKIVLVDEKHSTTLANSYIDLFDNTSLTKPKKRKQHGIIDKASALILLNKAYEEDLISC